MATKALPEINQKVATSPSLASVLTSNASRSDHSEATSQQRGSRSRVHEISNWSLDTVMRWSAENRLSRASPERVKDKDSVVCLPGDKICCQPTSSKRSCTRIRRCKRDMCAGKLPLSCLMGASYNDRPTISYSTHLPSFRLMKHAGYGIGIDGGFTLRQYTPAGRNASCHRKCRRGLALTGKTDLKFNFGVIKSTKYSIVRFVATARIEGSSPELCRQANAKIVVRIKAISKSGVKVSKSVKTKTLTFSEENSTQKIDLPLICEKEDGNSVSSCRIYLSSVLSTSPASRAGSLLPHCWVFLAGAHVVLDREKNMCNDSCSNDVPLSCVATVQQGVLQYSNTGKQDTGRPVSHLQEYGSCMVSFRRQKEEAVAANDFQRTDVFTFVSSRGSVIHYNLSSQWEKDDATPTPHDLLTGHIYFVAPGRADYNACLSSVPSGAIDQPLMAEVVMSIGQHKLLTRHLKVSRSIPVQPDVMPFAIKLDARSQVDSLSVHVSLVGGPNALERHYCGMVVLANATLTRQEEMATFSRCQVDCFSEISSHIVPLSCFLGRMRRRNHGFACPGQVTRRSDRNRFTQIVLANSMARIGIDRGGRWTPSSPIQLQHGNGMKMNGTHQRETFKRGIGAYPDTRINVNLTAFRAAGMDFTHFSSLAGLDLSSGCAPSGLSGVQFRILLDGRLAFSTDISHAWATKMLMVDVRNYLQLSLVTLRGRLQVMNRSPACTPAVWANPVLQKLVSSQSTPY